MNTHKDLMGMVCTEAIDTPTKLTMHDENQDIFPTREEGPPDYSDWCRDDLLAEIVKRDDRITALLRVSKEKTARLDVDRERLEHLRDTEADRDRYRDERNELQEQLKAIIAPVEVGGGIAAHLTAASSKEARLCFECADVKGRAEEWRNSKRPVWTAFCQSCEHRREVRVLSRRTCPQCKEDAVIEDGYCGTCRQCTLAPELTEGSAS